MRNLVGAILVLVGLVPLVLAQASAYEGISRPDSLH
jgi:hypothetical protein